MVAAFERNNLGLPYDCLINLFLAKFEVPSFDKDDFVSPSQPFTKKDVSQSQSHVRGVPFGVSSSSASTGDAAMAKKAEYDAAAAGEAAGERKQLPPVRTIRGQLCQFE